MEIGIIGNIKPKHELKKIVETGELKMKDLIEREKVLEAFLTKGSGYYNMMTLRDMINAIPSADILTDKDVEELEKLRKERYEQILEDAAKEGLL